MLLHQSIHLNISLSSGTPLTSHEPLPRKADAPLPPTTQGSEQELSPQVHRLGLLWPPASGVEAMTSIIVLL